MKPFSYGLIKFDAELRLAIKDLEKDRLQIYLCSSRVPTIGRGYALIVLSARWSIRPELKTKSRIAEIIGVTKKDIDNLEQIAEMLNSSKTYPEVKAVFDKQTYDMNLNKESLEELYQITIQTYIKETETRLASPQSSAHKRKKKKPNEDHKQLPPVVGLSNAEIVTLRNTREMVSLVSMDYRGQLLICQNLVNAIRSGNRQEAWFQIKTESINHYSGGNRKQGERGLYNRADAEAEKFGLYDDPEKPTVEEAARVIDLYRRHKDEIIAYDGKIRTTRAIRPVLEKAAEIMKAGGRDPGISFDEIPIKKPPQRRKVPAGKKPALPPAPTSPPDPWARAHDRWNPQDRIPQGRWNPVENDCRKIAKQPRSGGPQSWPTSRWPR